MPFAAALGEAAGVATFIANKNNISINEIDTNELLNCLKADGAFISKTLPN